MKRRDMDEKQLAASILGRPCHIIRKDHPHFGERGITKQIDHTAAGWALLIALQNCPHGETGCYVFHGSEIEIGEVS